MIREATFQPAWWLRNSHAQTIWASLCRRKPGVALRRERLELTDGDFLDLDWTAKRPACAPLVLIVHGLEGSSNSGYARGLLRAIVNHGWHGVVMNFRNCSGEPNRLARSYNAGDTADLHYVINTLTHRYPDTPLVCAGYSLGGNVLLKWLGEQGQHAQTLLKAATAVSVPLLLDSAARRMRQGFSRLYQGYLLSAMKANYRRKFATWPDHLPHLFPIEQLHQLRDFFDFDDKITAPLHGYDGVDDYYTSASSRQYLSSISAPTLILQAMDDPFMSTDILPQEEELSATVTLEISQQGGHVGFISGRWPWQTQYWLEQRIPEFFAEHLLT